MGIIIKNGIIYSSTDDCLKTSGGSMTGTINYNIDTASTNNVNALKITRDSYSNASIGSKTPSGMTGNISFNVACGTAGSGHSRTFAINGYEADTFTIRFGNADFGFIEQKTFTLENGSTYSATLVSTPYVVLIFPVAGSSGSGATTTENNPVYTATAMSSTGFTFKNLTSYTKFRYVALGVAPSYS